MLAGAYIAGTASYKLINEPAIPKNLKRVIEINTELKSPLFPNKNLESITETNITKCFSQTQQYTNNLIAEKDSLENLSNYNSENQEAEKNRENNERKALLGAFLAILSFSKCIAPYANNRENE